MTIVQTTEQDLRTRQIAQEEESLTLGIDRYKKDRERSDEADSGPGKRLLREAIALVAAGIETFVSEARNGKPGKKHTAVRWVEGFPASELAYLTCRTCMNAISTPETRVQSAAEAIATAVEDSINYSKFRVAAPGLHKHLQTVLKKATSQRHTRQVMEAALRRTMDAKDHFSFPGNDGIHFGMKMIEVFIETTGLAQLYLDTSHGQDKRRTLLRGTEAVLEWLDKAHDAAAHFTPIRMPMLVEPRPWSSSKGGGYLTDAGGLVPLVRTRNKAYLRELDNADMPKVYESLNTIQSTPWRVNSAVLAVMRDAWEAGGGIGDLPHRELISLPPIPAEDMERYKAENPEEFKAWKRSRAEIYEKNARSASKRVSAAQKIALAARFAPEEAIYFPHSLDFRGRVYPVPGTLNPQGDDQAKALLHFARGKPLGPSGAHWLAIHVANLFGVDKVPFEERIAWVHSNEDRILDSALDPLDGQRFWTEADSPYCALAACFEWAGYKMAGEDFVSHLPIALDGSCNGLQNFSAMLRDTLGGEATNLTPQERPADIYTKVMHVAAARIKAEAEAGNPFAITWDGTLTRDLVKQPVMTLPYGVTKSGMRNQIVEKCKKLGLDDSRDRAGYLADILWEAIGQVVIAAREAMDWLKDAAKVAAKGDMPVSWTTPAGFPVLQEYREAVGTEVNTYVAGRYLRITTNVDGTKLDGRRQALGISPNFVHSCDAAHLKLTVCTALDNGVTDFAMIHDSYGTHAADTDTLAASLRAAFVEQYSREVLTDFRDELAAQLSPELAEKLPELPPCGHLDLSLVEQSVYFFA